jgi:hypothetical protein
MRECWRQEEESARRRGQHDSVSEPGRKRAKLQEEDEEDEGKAGGGGRAGRAAQGPKVAIPSYLRSRFGDKGSAIGDAPPTPCPKGGEGAGSGEECSEGDYHEAVEKMVDERSRRNTATRRRNKEALTADNNILLFGQWYRKKLNIEGDQPAPTKVTTACGRLSCVAASCMPLGREPRLVSAILRGGAAVADVCCCFEG